LAEITQQQFVELIDTFNKAWSRPETWNEGETDERSVRIREMWAIEGDRLTVNLLGLIQRWLRHPQDARTSPRTTPCPPDGRTSRTS
jgi:hypothetical protein